MSIAKITLIGMYQWMNDQNDPLFKNLTVPAGMDKDKLINTILYIGAEFGVVYADPHFMQGMIGIWSDRYRHTLERWAKALAIDYDPLENYDRREEWSDVGTRSKAGSTSRLGSEIDGHSRADNEMNFSGRLGSDAGSTSRAEVNSTASAEATTNSSTTGQTTAGTKTGDQSDDHKVSAYDSGTYQNKDKTDTSTSGADVTASQTNSSGTNSVDGHVNSVGNENVSDSRSTSENGTDSRISNGSGNENRFTSESGNDAEEESHGAVHTGRTHGNIGVTTSQMMLQSELDIARFNIYDEAADLFLSEFCIYVY